MTPERALELARVELCHLSDDIIWDSLSREIQVAVAKVLDFSRADEGEAYSRGFEDAKAEYQGDTYTDFEVQVAKDEVRREIQRKLYTFAEGLHL